MSSSNLTIYSVFMAIERAKLQQKHLEADPLSPDLVFIKKLEIKNLEYVLKDLVRQ